LGFGLLVIGFFQPTKTAAISFDFIDILSQNFDRYFSVIHFGAGGNDYP